MKIWIQDIKKPSHRLVKLHCEAHSDYIYLGNLDDDALKDFFLSVQQDMDVDKNIKLIKYYGYLHLFVFEKKSE